MTDIAAIRAAAGRMAGAVRETPILSSPLLDRIAGRRVLVKAECLQVTGSFKARGAWAAWGWRREWRWEQIWPVYRESETFRRNHA